MEGYTDLYLSARDLVYGCIGCGVLVVDPQDHDRWCPAKEHERRMADYAKVFKENLLERLDHMNPPVFLDHKEP